MTSTMRRLAALALMIGALASPGRAGADFIVYTETVTATGSLGGAAYTNALVTLTATGDTGGVVTTSPVSVANPVTVTLTVAGLTGTATLTGPYVAFRSGSLAGIARGTPAARGSDLLGVNDTAFNSYGLATEIGPISGVASFNSTTGFATDAGEFFINAVSGDATFRASVVPEPSSLALAGIGLAVGIGLASRRRSTAA